MMSYKKVIPFLIIFFSGVYNQSLKAQALDISGDTIFINEVAEIQVIFPTQPKSFSAAPNNAPYRFQIEGKRVSIIAGSEYSGPTTLLVFEAERKHRFIVLFKKDINYSHGSELFYDYSTEKKLEEHIRETVLRRTVASEKIVVNANSKAEPVDNYSVYNALLQQGEKDFKQQNLEDAKSSFDKADILRPEDSIPLQRLAEIKMKLAAKVKTFQSKNENDYSIIIAGAIYSLSQREYAQAREAYKQALDVMPGDLYATRQLETINNLLPESNGQNEQQKKDSYDEYISQGEKAFTKNQLTDARKAYKQALVIRQNDVLATSRLELIEEQEKLQKDKEALKNKYMTLIHSADKYYREGDFNNARIEYNKAMRTLKKLYPQEQVGKTGKISAEQISKENNENQKQGQESPAGSEVKAKKTLEDSYDAAVQLADKYYKEGDYENAKISYNKALGFIKKDLPREQINEINKIIARQVAGEKTELYEKQQQDLNNKYINAMDSANKFFDAGNYANAKIEYNKAISIIPNSLPQEQIKKINKIMTEQLVNANIEKQRMAHDAEIKSRYTALLENADIEFDKSNYIKAKKLYADASGLEPAEEYPKERLITIENNLAKIQSGLNENINRRSEEVSISQKYNLALLNGKSSYKKNDLLNAKSFYEEATNLKPLEEEPKKQLNIINVRLAEIARIDEINGKYESKIALADSQLIEKAYNSPLNSYNEGLIIKPLESYPVLQIKYIQSEIISNQKLKEINKRKEGERRFNDALAGAEKAVKDKRYRDAKYSYVQALAIHPENDYARSRLKIISYQVEKVRADKLKPLAVIKVDEDPAVTRNKEKAKKGKRKAVGDIMVLQSTPIPYTIEELKRKYPNIDLSTSPVEQPFDNSVVYSKEIIPAYDTILLEKPRLDSSSNDQGITLICQGINFRDTIVYIKLLIRNYSNTDFLTGPMMLTWTKKDGNPVKVSPYYLLPSNLTILKPSNEAFVIYVCKFKDILDEESLSFELTDRSKKVKLQMRIPGSVYNQEWARQL